MSFRKFGENDFFTNTIRAYPKVNFYISGSKVFYNSVPRREGTRNKAGNVKVPQDFANPASGPDTTGRIETVANTDDTKSVKNIHRGHLSLYEYNIDRPELATDRIVGSFVGPNTTSSLSYSERVAEYNRDSKPIDFVQDKGIIYPFISKDGARASWKTVQSNDYSTAFKYGDVLVSSYPLSASITREYITAPFASTSSYNAHYVALRNRLNFYGARSAHYLVDSPFGKGSSSKDKAKLNLISIPSIFYGSRIKPGSISLKFYIRGRLIGELTDSRENGELIQVSGSDSTTDGRVAGVALYDEGFLLITGSWALTVETFGFVAASSSPSSDNPKWIYFGAGTHDGVLASNTAAGFSQASFDISFKGHTETQVMTMFAHANRGEANYSNNPTYIKKGQTRNEYVSRHTFEQRNDVLIKNIASSSYSDYNAPFKRQVYISRVGVYDQYKNLIGLATLSNPILKEDKDNISFKLKLDI